MEIVKHKIEIARHKNLRPSYMGYIWGVKFLNIACASLPAIALYASLLVLGDARYVAARMLPQPVYNVAMFAAAFSYPGLICGLLIAGAVFFLVESKTAKGAATSYYAGFVVSIASLFVFSRLLP